jgi:hypothetical protein
VVDSQAPPDIEETETRETYETVWVYGLFILMILGFFVSSYCIFSKPTIDKIKHKWTPRPKVPTLKIDESI